MSSYNPNIPTISQFMLESLPQIRANFQAINTVFSENHEDLNSEFQGMHTVLNLTSQTGNPTTSEAQISLYTKTVSSNTVLFYEPNSSQTPIQMTYPSISTGKNNATPPVYLTTQQTFLPGPFVFYSGLIVGANQGQTITLTPSSTLIYVGLFIKDFKNGSQGALTFANACATGINGNMGASPGTFNVQFVTGLPSQNISYIAIGV